jgi:DNA-binding XRE family transcriptional regulator
MYKKNNFDTVIDEIIKELQLNLASTRKLKNITQEQLSQLVGLEPKSISDIETNRRKASLTTFVKILHILEIDILTIFNKKL